MQDDIGLINAILLDGKGGGVDLDWHDLSHWTSEEGVLWLNFDYTHADARLWLKEQSGLDPLIAEVLLTEVTRPRSLVNYDGLLVVIRGVNMNPNDSPDDMVSVRMWIEEKRVITTRHREIFSINEITSLIKKGVGPSNAGEFLTRLAWLLADRIADVVQEINDQVDDLEDKVVDAESYALRVDLARIAQAINQFSSVPGTTARCLQSVV